LESAEIILRSQSGEEISAVVQYGPEGDLCHLFVRYQDREFRGAASDYFDALAEVRQQLAPSGLTPICYGASRNVFPSGMAREMGAGLSAYKLTVGDRPSQDDLVNILATGPDVQPTTVAEQRAYFESWLASVETGRRRWWQFWEP
jgi:hypothetical protein